MDYGALQYDIIIIERCTAVARVIPLECILSMVPGSIPAGYGQFIRWEDQFSSCKWLYGITFGRSDTSHVAQIFLHHKADGFTRAVGFPPASDL